MKSSARRRVAIGVVSVLIAAILASCSTPVGQTPAATNFRFQANRVKVVNHNDTFLYGNRDEPFVYNLWFRVKVGVPNSAQVGLVGSRDNAIDDLGDGESKALVGAQQATVDYDNVQLMDVGDLLNTNNHLEIVGTWTWAMDEDDISVGGVADDTLTVMRNALNATVGAGSIPTDTNALVGQILGDFGTAFNLIAGALFSSIPGLPDDTIGSRFYIGVGAKGTLSDIIDATVPDSVFPTVQIPVISVPPDIGGGQIFSLGQNRSYVGEPFDQGDGRHDYDVTMINTATLPKPPIATFSPSLTSAPGGPSVQVDFDGRASSDPDGHVVAYNWNFGDFTTGSGSTASHIYNYSGNFPATLTVTDDSGMSSSSTVTINVGGPPTSAPTGLSKINSGCCDTWGDFSWSQVPGATAYQIHMGSYFGGGCLTDADAVINGQVATGRVQKVGLCLGSKYDTKIRAQSNGQWGPWSNEVRITL